MISTLTIEGFRCFERLEMGGLGRVNLIVGKNNSGKTSVLEALYLLQERGEQRAIVEILRRRGELLPSDPPSRAQFDLDNLFVGRRAQDGSELSVRAEGAGGGRIGITLSISLMSQDQPGFSHGVPNVGPVLMVRGPSKNSKIPLGDRGSITEPSNGLTSSDSEIEGGAFFLGPESCWGRQLIELWDEVALTDAESLVIQFLQAIDPSIERVAPQVGTRDHYRATRGGFVVRHRGNDRRTGIGSEGDGVWRMLALAIFLAQAKGGTLLVDEIDSGLHYEAMTEMWKLVFQAAKDADVQVFATTHSVDCINSFAELTRLTDDNNRISLQRVEAGNPKAVSYTEGQIRVVAEDPVEAR